MCFEAGRRENLDTGSSLIRIQGIGPYDQDRIFQTSAPEFSGKRCSQTWHVRHSGGLAKSRLFSQPATQGGFAFTGFRLVPLEVIQSPLGRGVSRTEALAIATPVASAKEVLLSGCSLPMHAATETSRPL